MILSSPCIPSGDLFLGPLGDVIDSITSGIGGLLWPLAIAMIIVCAVAFVVSALNKDANKYLRAAIMVVAVVFLAILLVLLLSTVLMGFNNMC